MMGVIDCEEAVLVVALIVELAWVWPVIASKFGGGVWPTENNCYRCSSGSGRRRLRFDNLGFCFLFFHSDGFGGMDRKAMKLA